MGVGNDVSIVKFKLTFGVIEACIESGIWMLDTRTSNPELRASIPASSPLNDINLIRNRLRNRYPYQRTKQFPSFTGVPHYRSPATKSVRSFSLRSLLFHVSMDGTI